MVRPRAEKLVSESAFEVLRQARELEAEGRDIVHLEIGQPDFPTPAHITDAAIEALRAGHTGYGPSQGLPGLRQSIARSAGELRGIELDPDRVVVTPGAKPLLLYAINSLAGAGDEVIYPDPGFPMYRSLIAHSGARPVPLVLREENDFRFDPDEFRSLVSDRTRLLIINSPQNPTGGSLESADLETIAEVAEKHDFFVAADEIYSRFVYDGRFESLASLPGMLERTLILDGFSKTYSMTGWRLGYAILPAALVPIFDLYNVNIASCACTFNQYGAQAALDGPQDCVETMVAEFARRRDVLIEGLDGLPGVSCRKPRGAFYAFPNVRGTGIDAEELAGRLLREAGLAVLAGKSFGPAGDGYLRLSYATSLERIEEALARIRRFLSSEAQTATG